MKIRPIELLNYFPFLHDVSKRFSNIVDASKVSTSVTCICNFQTTEYQSWCQCLCIANVLRDYIVTIQASCSHNVPLHNSSFICIMKAVCIIEVLNLLGLLRNNCYCDFDKYIHIQGLPSPFTFQYTKDKECPPYVTLPCQSFEIISNRATKS